MTNALPNACPDLPPDPERRDRWMPRPMAAEPIGPMGLSAHLRLEHAEAQVPTRTVASVASAWLAGCECTPLDRQAFVLFALGRRDGDIAEALGVSRRAVTNMVRRAGRALVERARDLTDAPLPRAALTLWLAEESRTVVAHVLGVRLESLERVLGRFVREALSDLGSASMLAADCCADASAPRRSGARVLVIG